MSFLKKINQSSFIFWIAGIAFSLIFLGIKFGIIFHFGRAIPFWDQWDAEADKLYKPFLEGALTVKQLLALHNEHRIFTTRFLALLLLKMNGLWNPLLQMIVNAILHLVVLLLAWVLLCYSLGKKAFVPLALFILVFFSIPFGWENTLSGFQAQFYFALLFSIITLFLIIITESLSFYWWVGIFSGLLGFFSFASGVLVFAGGAGILGIQYLLGISRSWRQVVAVLLLGACFIAGIIATPITMSHSIEAHSIGQFFNALIPSLSWPLPGNVLFWFFVRNAPSIIFCVTFLFLRAPKTDRRWFLFGLIIWGLLQAASIAYGRAVGGLPSRYLDLFAFSVLTNFACLLEVLKNFFGKSKLVKIGVFIIWTGLIFFWLFSAFRKDLYNQLTSKRNDSIAQIVNVSNYQHSGNMSNLRGKASCLIPYPDPNRLALILSYPTIQQILPTCIHKPSQDGTSVHGRLDAGVNFLLAHYFILIEIGVLIALLLAVVLVFC